MPEISLPFGRGETSVRLPEQWAVQHVAEPALKPAAPDWPDRLAAALNEPVAGPRLSELLAGCRHGHLSIIVEDVTRHSPLDRILPVVLREVRHAGIGNDQIEFLFATGMHPAMTPQQAAAKLGEAGAGIAWRCNPWGSEKQYVRLGKTAGLDVRIDRGVAGANLRIMISSVSAHLQAGFGGGHKMLVPGCAALSTIRALHRLGLPRRPQPLAGTEASRNPMRQAIDAAGALVEQQCGPCFGIQYLLDGADLPTSIAAGSVLPAQQMIAKHCAIGCGSLVSQPADIVLASAAPRDFDLWQSFKAIANTRWAARPQGLIICLSRCEGGLNGVKPPSRWPLKPATMRRLIGMLGAETIASIITRLVPNMAGDAAFFIRMAAQTLGRNPIFMVAPGLVEQGASFPGVELFGETESAIAAAAELMGGGSQRVAVFPSGGSTFTIPPAGRA
jgi:nickel-dependent lactate racemase